MANATTNTTIELVKAKLKNRTLAQRIENQHKLFKSDSERVNFDSTNQEIIKYIRTDLSQFLNTSQSKGEKRGKYMYTSKVSTDLERSADAFVGNVFVQKGWFGYAMKETWANQINEIQNWLQECEEHFYSVFSDAKFISSIMPPVAMDALSIGDGIIYEGVIKSNPKRPKILVKDEGKLYFRYCEIMNTWFRRDRFGRLLALHYEIDMCALEAYGLWGDSLSDEVIKAAYESPLKCFKFIQAVYKRDDPIFSDIEHFDIERDYIELFIQKDSQDNRDNTNQNQMAGILAQEGYHTMPFMDWPYFLKSNENYGRGPLGTALITVKRLHGMNKTAMVKAQRDAAPPLRAYKGQKNKLELGPDGVNWVKDPTKEIIDEIYKSRTGYTSNIDYIQRTEEQIEDVLHLSLYLAISLVTKQMQNPEVYERIGEKAAMLVPRLGLMNNIFLEQIHDRTWQIEEMAGRLPPPPMIIRQLQMLPINHPQHISGKINVLYKGPLVEAQEQLFSQRRIMGNLQGVAALAKATGDEQAAGDVIDVERATEHILDEGNFWQDSIRDEEQREARKKFRMQMLMAQQQAEIQSKEAGAMKNVAGALKETG